MFKKFFVLFLTFSLLSVQANAGLNSNLKTAFDDLNYELTVEWDQKDKSFYDQKMKEFLATLTALQSKGLTNEKLLEFVKAQVKDEKVVRDLDTAFSVIFMNQMTTEEASRYMVDTMKKSYSAGASWSGAPILYIGIGVLLVAAAVAAVVEYGKKESEDAYSGNTQCIDYYVCDAKCYYDSFGGYNCEDVCYWTCK